MTTPELLTLSRNILVMAGFILVARLIIRPTTKSNPHNNQCSHDFFLICRAINHTPTPASLYEFEDSIDDFFATYIDKADEEMVRYLTAELHSILANRSAQLRFKIPFAEMSVN